MERFPLTESILQQIMINKYSGNTTVFVDDIEYEVGRRIDNTIELKKVQSYETNRSFKPTPRSEMGLHKSIWGLEKKVSHEEE